MQKNIDAMMNQVSQLKYFIQKLSIKAELQSKIHLQLISIQKLCHQQYSQIMTSNQHLESLQILLFSKNTECKELIHRHTSILQILQILCYQQQFTLLQDKISQYKKNNLEDTYLLQNNSILNDGFCKYQHEDNDIEHCLAVIKNPINSFQVKENVWLSMMYKLEPQRQQNDKSLLHHIDTQEIKTKIKQIQDDIESDESKISIILDDLTIKSKQTSQKIQFKTQNNHRMKQINKINKQYCKSKQQLRKKNIDKTAIRPKSIKKLEIDKQNCQGHLKNHIKQKSIKIVNIHLQKNEKIALTAKKNSSISTAKRQTQKKTTKKVEISHFQH